MKHIKIFDSQSAFDAANVEAPYLVSVAGSVVYSGSAAPVYEMVDLGLPSGLKWAKCNVGAEKETDYGLYFKWGDIVGHDSTECNHDDSILIVDLDEHDVLLSTYDAATQLLGDGYRIPTKWEMEELIKNTDHAVITINDVKGMKFAKKDDADTYIFIPFAGCCSLHTLKSVGRDFYLWSSTIDVEQDVCAYYLGSYNDTNITIGSCVRVVGCSVRAVCE